MGPEQSPACGRPAAAQPAPGSGENERNPGVAAAAGLPRQAAAAIDAIADALITLGQIAAEHPEIRELDINPLPTDADGVTALDARIRVVAGGAARLAIAPYPKELGPAAIGAPERTSI